MIGISLLHRLSLYLLFSLVEDKQFSMPFKIISYSLLIISSVLLAFSFFQNEVIYNNSLGQISHNYTNDGDQIFPQVKSFESITEDKFIHWDVLAYHKLKNDLYLTKGDYPKLNFAFFPLFPIIWKMTGLSEKYIGFLNYGFFILGVVFLGLALAEKPFETSKTEYLILCLLPTNCVFFIPYSEALFFLTFSIAIWAFIKDYKIWLFLALFLNATSRSSGNIILLSMLAVDSVYFFKNGFDVVKIKKAVLYRYLPIVLGIILVGLIQMYYGSPSFFYFFSVQKEFWGLYLSWPGEISDWSKEGFALNYGTVFLVVLPTLLYVTKNGFAIFVKSIDFPQANQSDETSSKKEFLFFVSSVYILANFLITIFFRHGSINTLFRYAIATPFFFFVCLMFDQIIQLSLKKKILFLVSTLILAIFFLSYIPFASNVDFQWVGFFLLYWFGFLFLLKEYRKFIVYKIGLVVYCIMSVIWQAYLLNVYLSDGWIFL